MNDDRELVSLLCERKQQLESRRDQWSNHWDDLSEYILPRKDQVYGYALNRNNGEQKHNKLYDSTAIHANEQLASALHTALMSPTSKWFNFVVSNYEVNSDYEVQLWLEDTRDRVFSVINNTNLHSQANENFLDISCTGTSFLAMEEDNKDVVSFMARPVYDVLVDENYKKVFICLRM